jgi:putative hydrolase of the HAD superfamily
VKVFFDVDGVLIDGWHADIARRKPWDATIEVDLGVDRGAFQLLFFGTPGNRSASPMFECVTGRRDLKQALAAILPDVGYKGSVDDFVRYWFEKDSRLDPDVFGIVRELRERGRAQIFVATGQEHYRAAYLWDELGFSSHFDRLFYSAQIGVPKKDLRFFEAINRALGIEPGERPVFFDDQPEIVELANRAGWDAAIFTSVRDIHQHPRLRHLWA